jgi:hypothetical protein
VGLVTSVVLGAETPVNVWEDWFLFEVYCTEDTAAYFYSLLPMLRSREKRGLSAFSTSLAKKHGKRDFSQAISPFSLSCFCFNHAKKNEKHTLNPCLIETNGETQDSQSQLPYNSAKQKGR